MKLNNLDLKWLGNSSFLAETEGGKVIYIDPYQFVGEGVKKADIILITHPHYDHCSLEDIQKIVKEGTIVVMPADCQSKVARLENIKMQIIGAGQTLSLEGIKIGGVPAYNIDKEFHSRNEGWLGYVLKLGNLIIYHAGDTDLIPEMQKLDGHGKNNEFVALLPVGGTYTMDAEQAAEAASIIKPTLAIPMHYGSAAGSRKDAEKFVELCQSKGIKAEILEKN